MSSDVEKCLYGFFEAILDEMSDGIYITDRAGTTICVNRMYEQLTGLRKDDIRGRDVRDLVGSGVFDIALNPEIVRTGKPTTHVQHLKDGKTLVLSGYPVFDDDGGLRFVVTFARDITLMTRLNDQINRQRSLVSQTAGQIEYVARRQLLKSQSPTFASQSMKRVITLVDRVAPTDATVLILGETGVGKDVIARLVHNKSSRRDKLMLKVDCGGISETLTESEMFGYVGGAFTGASSKGKAGYFEIANGSTVFLDEIGELPLSMQTRLLRVLQDGEIVRVGSSQPRKVDVRVIAATNKNLKECVDAGTFRRDLYYRLNVAVLEIPPLRERRDDIAPLAKSFLEEFSAKYHKNLHFMDITLEMMRNYSWPGNVRQLVNTIERAVNIAQGEILEPRHLPENILMAETGKEVVPSFFTDTPHIPGASAIPQDTVKSVRHHKKPTKDMLLQAIENCDGNISVACTELGISRSTIYRYMRKFGIEVDQIRS